MTFAETQQYDVGLKPHPRFPQQQNYMHKPSLAAMFDLVKTYMMTRQGGLPILISKPKHSPPPIIFITRHRKLLWIC